MEPQNQRPRSPDGRWEWDGRQWQPVPQAPPPPQQPYKLGKGGLVLILAVAGFIALMVIAMIGSAATSPPVPVSSPKPVSATTSTPTSTPTPTARPTATPRPPTPPPTPRPEPVALFDVNGQNSGETTAFDGPSHYKVTYSFDCANTYGGTGNFILRPVDSNGNSLAGSLVNRLAASGNGTADGYNWGTQKGMRLQVISTCSWSVKGMTT